MGPLGFVEGHPLIDHPLGLEAVGEVVQVDRLVLHRSPETLDEDVVEPAPPAVHGDLHLRRPQSPGEGMAGELAALIGVEDLRLAVPG